MSSIVPKGIRNNNPGNIEYNESTKHFVGCLMSDGRFCVFSSSVNGIRALGIVLLNYKKLHKITTIKDAIARWAPSSDKNNTVAYIEDISRRTGFPSEAVIDFFDSHVLTELIKAIIWHENGQQPYQNLTITAAVNAALGAIHASPSP